MDIFSIKIKRLERIHIAYISIISVLIAILTHSLLAKNDSFGPSKKSLLSSGETKFELSRSKSGSKIESIVVPRATLFGFQWINGINDKTFALTSTITIALELSDQQVEKLNEAIKNALGLLTDLEERHLQIDFDGVERYFRIPVIPLGQGIRSQFLSEAEDIIGQAKTNILEQVLDKPFHAFGARARKIRLSTDGKLTVEYFTEAMKLEKAPIRDMATRYPYLQKDLFSKTIDLEKQ